MTIPELITNILISQGVPHITIYDDIIFVDHERDARFYSDYRIHITTNKCAVTVRSIICDYECPVAIRTKTTVDVANPEVDLEKIIVDAIYKTRIPRTTEVPLYTPSI